MQIKTRRHNFTLIAMPLSKNTDIPKGWQAWGAIAQQGWWESEWCCHLGKQSRHLLEISIPCDSAILPLIIAQEELKPNVHTQKNLNVNIIAAFFVIAKQWKQSHVHPQINVWTHLKIYTMGHTSVRNALWVPVYKFSGAVHWMKAIHLTGHTLHNLIMQHC